MKRVDNRSKRQIPGHPMAYEWNVSENLSDKYHASDDFGYALCSRTIRLHNGLGPLDTIPEYHACQKCVRLFRKMVINNCVAIRKERIALGEIEGAP